MGSLTEFRNSIRSSRNNRKKHEDWIKWLKGNSKIYDVYYNTPLDENLVFLESRDGNDFTGNILRICAELHKPAYGNLRFCIYARGDVEQMIRSLAGRYGMDPGRMVFIQSERDAVEWMEKAKYLVSDSGIPWMYVKREGQVMLNTWHGTPLKVMGKFTPTEEHRIGTVQHFFLSSDYILYPSYYMKDIMLRSYMMDKVATGKAVMSGYPRNSVFLDREAARRTREELGFGDKTVYVYMPTHRGNSKKSKNSTQLGDVIDYLSELDIMLRDDEEVLVKLHVYNQSRIDFYQFDHIKPFPEGYEPYDVLNAADGLITDYSSVMFDYGNARKKIILFTYDKEEYFEDRGVYFPMEELPFPTVSTPSELLQEMRTPMEYDDTAFREKFCTFDSLDATEKICRHMFLEEKVCKEEPIGNGKENVLIFGGSLAKNGITSALYGLLNNVDTSKRNYFLTFWRAEVNADPTRVHNIPEHIDYLPLMNDQMYTYEERMAYDEFANSQDLDKPYPELLHRLFKREWDRYFWGVRFSRVIEFDGYGKNANMFFMEHPHNSVFVHSDMLKEIRIRGLQHGPTLRQVYRSADHVAVVSPAMIQPTADISGCEDNIVVVNNVFDYANIRRRAELPREIDKDTLVRCWDPDGVNGFFSGDGYKFITVGRFSVEKGHDRLIAAFERFSVDHPDAKLMIIGGHGNRYDQTIRNALDTKCWKNIYIIRSLSNPMPYIKGSDMMILSSFYEGFGLVILEADCLGVPAMSTDIPGPRSLMANHGGHLVEDSEDGILQGMNDFAAGMVHTLDIDYEAVMHQALNEFESLFEEDING